MTPPKNNGKRETMRAFFWSMSSKILTYLLVLVLGNFYIISEYGKASFILAIFNISIMISIFGIPSATVPWIIKKKDYNSVFRFVLYVVLLGGVLTLLVTGVAIFLRGYNPHLFWLMVVMALAMIFYWINNVCSSFLIARKRYSFVNMAGAASMFITLILVILLREFMAFGIIIAYATGHLVSAILVLIVEREKFWEVIRIFKIKLSSIKEYLKEGVLISLITLSFYFLGWADSTILGLLTNLESVGKYNIASAFSNVLVIIPVVLSMFVITRMSEITSVSKSLKILRRVIRVSYSFCLLLGILVAATLPLLIKYLFPKYVGIESYASLLLVGAIFYSVYFLVYSYFIAKMNVRKHFSPIILAAVVNIILDIILIPFFGIYGVCVATVLAHLSAFCLLSKNVLKPQETVLMILMALTIFAAYLLSYVGLILLILMPLFLFKLGLVKIGDLRVVYLELKYLFVKDKISA